MSRRWLAPEEAVRPRPARSRGDRARARRSLARRRQRRRAARRAGLARLPERGGGAGGAGLAASGSRRWRASGARRGCMGRGRRSGSPPSACRSSRRSGLERGSSPAIAAPAAYAGRDWAQDDALVEILRGRLEGLGPVTESALAAPLGLEPQRHRGRARGAAGRRLRHARPLHAGRGRRTNGASAGCSPASTTTRSSACAPRSSRSPRATSCASCSAGSASRRMRACRGRMRSR